MHADALPDGRPDPQHRRARHGRLRASPATSSSAAFNDELPVPVTVLKQIRTPAFVGPEHARVRGVVLGRHRGDGLDGAQRGRAGRAARRGLVRRRARSARARRRRAAHAVPAGLPAARRGRRAGRAAVHVLYRIGLAPGAHALLDARAGSSSRAGATRAGPTVEGAANPARELARQIGRTIPLIYGGGALGAVAAYRWKCDVNENAKAPAFWHTVSRARPQRDLRVGPARRRHPPAASRSSSCGTASSTSGCGCASTRPARSSRSACTRCSSVEAEGEGRLAQLLDLMYVGDWTSCYLALQNDVDPGPIDAIFDVEGRGCAATA